MIIYGYLACLAVVFTHKGHGGIHKEKLRSAYSVRDV